MKVCEHGLASDPQDPELLFRQGMIQHQLGKHIEAVNSYRDSMRPRPPSLSLRSVEIGIGDFLSRHNLAAVYSEMRRDDLAELEYRRIIAERPNYRPAFPLLARVLLRQHRMTTLETEIEHHTGNERLTCELAQMRGSLAATRGDFSQASREFATAVAADPLDSKARLAQCELLFHKGEFAETVDAFKELERLCPKDSSTPFNLAVVLSNHKHLQDALAAVDRSLNLRPDYPAAIDLRCEILVKLGVIENGNPCDAD